MRARGRLQVGDVLRAAHAGGTLEGVGLGALAGVGPAPGGVEVVHLVGDAVGVVVTGAKYDRLLLGTAGLDQVGEQVGAHGGHALGHEQQRLEALGAVVLASLGQNRVDH